MIKTILGIDCSSKTIGYCILKLDTDTNDIKYHHMDYISPIKHDDLIHRLADTRDKVKEVIDKYNPDYIGVENIISFMAGKSTAQTIIMLTTFNRMVCLLAHDHLKHSPELFNVMTIRHGIKKDKELPAKEDIPELVASHLNIKFPYIYTKATKTRKSKIKEESMDMADGVAVALYYALKLTNNLYKKPKLSKKK